MLPERLPRLTDDKDTLDWGEAAAYTANVERPNPTQPSVDVTHALSDAAPISAASAAGHAAYSVEVRSPRTLFAEEHTSHQVQQSVTWDSSVVEERGGSLLSAITVTSKQHQMPTTGMHEFFATNTTLDVPAGWRLASAKPVRLQVLLKSMLVFRKDEQLTHGRMTVEEDASADTPRFIARCAPDVHAVITGQQPASAEVQALYQLVALTGLCAKLPSSHLSNKHDRKGKFADYTATNNLANKFQAANAGHWDDEGWEPVTAATALLPVRAPVTQHDDE